MKDGDKYIRDKTRNVTYDKDVAKIDSDILNLGEDAFKKKYGKPKRQINQGSAASWLNLRERISQTMIPKELTGVSPEYIEENYLKPLIRGKTNEGDILTKETIPQIYGEDNIDPQIDMFRKYLGLDQHFNTMIPSENEPIDDKLHGDEYFDFNPEYKQKMIDDLKNAYGGFDEVVDVHNLTGDERTVFDHDTGEGTGKATTLFPLSRHQETVRYDEDRGERYIQYRDIQDFNPKVLKKLGMGDVLNKANKPYNIYGRLYESDFEHGIDTRNAPTEHKERSIQAVMDALGLTRKEVVEELRNAGKL